MRDWTKKLPTLDSHVDGENGAKTIVYNTKRDSKIRREKKKTKDKNKRLKKYNSKKERTQNY